MAKGSKGGTVYYYPVGTKKYNANYDSIFRSSKSKAKKNDGEKKNSKQPRSL